MKIGAFAPLFLPPITVGVPVVYVQDYFQKPWGHYLTCLSTPRPSFSVTVFVLGKIMRKLLVVLFVCIAFCAHARVLHVGDNTIKLSQTKTTNPALHVRVGDELWYGAMCTNFNLNSLHIKYNDKVYDVIEPFTDTTNYTYDENGRLIAANENIYLESTGTQLIDTEHVPTLVTRSELELKFSDDNKKSDGYSGFFGIADFYDAKSSYALNFGADGQYYNIYPWICAFSGSGGPSWCSVPQWKPLTITVEEKTTKQLVILDAKNNLLRYGNQTKELQGRKTTEKESVILFGIRGTDKNNNKRLRSYQQTDAMYIYSTKIYEDDVLVRHFVPVPCGLKIGDFVVPSNGMWDIVEQKFYGNMGTGDFIYGIDE